MRYWISDTLPMEDGTLMRAEHLDDVPEVLKRRRLVWESTPSLMGANTWTQDWSEITEAEAERIEAHQRAKALRASA